MSAPAFAETPSSSCNLYAANGGSDSNVGTASAPFATVRHLMEKLAAGQTGCLDSGETFAGFTVAEGNTHGTETAPVTLTSTNPQVPAIIDTRIVTEKGANWLVFTHLTIESDVLSKTENPSPTVASAHTSWTYDDISGGGIDICVLTTYPGDPYGSGEYTLLEHDRVHNCGHPVTKEEMECQSRTLEPVCSISDIDIFEGRLNGWHAHGLYNEGNYTTVRNSYFYTNGSKGILLRGGTGAVIEHNVIDDNPSGLAFGEDEQSHATVAWNIITGSTSPCAKEVPTGYRCDSFGVWSTTPGAGDVVRDNDIYGNEGGNIAPGSDMSSAVVVEHNIEADPRYTDASAHGYTLQAGSPATGYGPDNAQPAGTAEPPAPPVAETPVTTKPPAVEAPKKRTPPVYHHPGIGWYHHIRASTALVRHAKRAQASKGKKHRRSRGAALSRRRRRSRTRRA